MQLTGSFLIATAIFGAVGLAGSTTTVQNPKDIKVHCKNAPEARVKRVCANIGGDYLEDEYCCVRWQDLQNWEKGCVHWGGKTDGYTKGC